MAFAIEIAKKAGGILLDVYRTDFGVDWKDTDGSPVTEADRRANALLVEALAQRFVGDGIVSEEGADQGSACGKSRVWYVDPLDGTREFVARNGEFSVMVGLALDGEARLGVVYQPTTDKLYVGQVLVGAWRFSGGEKTPLCAGATLALGAPRLVVSRSHRPAITDELVRVLGITQEVACGSVGLKVGLIAENQAELYVHMSDRAAAWDLCAPDAILRAAQGRFTDVVGEPIAYDPHELRATTGILACSRAVFDTVAPHVATVARRVGVRPVSK